MTNKEKADQHSDPELPQDFRLEQNHPNPFERKTTIRFLVPRLSSVRLLVLNRDHEQVRLLYEGEAEPGWYDLPWDGMNEEGIPVPAGSYQYRLETKRYVATRKLEIK
jgi:hypothetical protein